jgi:uncharacterized protein YecT (DUF1311 family)
VYPLFRSAALAGAVLISLGLTAASAAGLPIVKKTITWKTAHAELTVSYPQTGNRAIDAVLLAFAAKDVADFKKAVVATGAPMADMGYSRGLGYTVERNDGKMLGIVFNGDEFLGGAHPSHDETAFNFTVPDGAQVLLGEILDGKKGIARLSAIVTAKLMKEIATGPNASSDSDSVKSGASAIEDNFKVFILLPDRLHLYFPEYQVASYAAGPQETTVDLKLLKDVMRANWHAPAASFDCGKARTTNEKTICADFALARLDRAVADAYAFAFQNTGSYDPDTQKKLLESQRAFVATTARTCTGDKLGPCLTKAYTARLAVLKGPYQ